MQTLEFKSQNLCKAGHENLKLSPKSPDVRRETETREFLEDPATQPGWAAQPRTQSREQQHKKKHVVANKGQGKGCYLRVLWRQHVSILTPICTCLHIQFIHIYTHTHIHTCTTYKRISQVIVSIRRESGRNLNTPWMRPEKSTNFLPN